MHVLQCGRTPLHEAAFNGQTGAVKILASSGAIVEGIDEVS